MLRKIYALNPSTTNNLSWMNAIRKAETRLGLVRRDVCLSACVVGECMSNTHANFLFRAQAASSRHLISDNSYLWIVAEEYADENILIKLLSSDVDLAVAIEKDVAVVINKLSDHTETLGFDCCLIKKSLLDCYQLEKFYAGEYMAPWRAVKKALILEGKSITAVPINDRSVT
jgi:hypothetical protein